MSRILKGWKKRKIFFQIILAKEDASAWTRAFILSQILIRHNGKVDQNTILPVAWPVPIFAENVVRA